MSILISRQNSQSQNIIKFRHKMMETNFLENSCLLKNSGLSKCPVRIFKSR